MKANESSYLYDTNLKIKWNSYSKEMESWIKAKYKETNDQRWRKKQIVRKFIHLPDIRPHCSIQ